MRLKNYLYASSNYYHVMDWAVDMTALIVTSVTCCGQEAQSMSDTSGGRSGTRSCWWMVDQICADPVWPPTPECVVLRTLLQLTYMWNANQLCPSRVFPVQRVWCHTECWLNGNGGAHITEVSLHRARLVLRWVTVCEFELCSHRLSG